MSSVDEILERNREWSEQVSREDPEFFARLSRDQAPEYLWIGCSDSRVPANQVTGLMPGDIFVHRNIANVVIHTDLNCQSTIQFAVDLLKVRHIIVCGHYGCSGVHAAMAGTRVGLADLWLQHVGQVRDRHADLLADVDSEKLRYARLCELNAIEQAVNVCRSTTVQDAWARGQPLTVHAWIYALFDGRIRQLGEGIDGPGSLSRNYDRAIAEVRHGRRVPGMEKLKA